MIEAQVQALLLSLPGVVALVGDRVYPTTLPPGAELPALTYREISLADLTDDNDGPGELIRPRFEIDAWSRDYVEVVELAEAVAGIRGFRGDVLGVPMQNIKRVGRQPFFEPDTKLHRIAQDFFVWGKE